METQQPAKSPEVDETIKLVYKGSKLIGKVIFVGGQKIFKKLNKQEVEQTKISEEEFDDYWKN